MKILGYILLGALAAIAAHLFVIFQAPNVIMNRAMDGASFGATQINQWRHAPRATPTPPNAPPETRGIVRPSTDLAYSICVFDLSKGPVRLRAAPWDDYVSLSLYAANSDNFWKQNDRDAGGKAIEIVLARKGDDTAGAAGIARVESPTAKGIALIRRLAPDAAAFARAEDARKGDICAPL
jgi:uncharacterized membrane protein